MANGRGSMQWPAALGAGLIPGIILLVVPWGSPWSGLTFFAPVIVGRVVPPTMNLPLPVVWIIQLGLSLVYGLIISRVVAHLRQERAIIVGGITGFILYLINWGIVVLAWPAWHNSQFGVLFAHVVFGLIAGGAYRGLRQPEVPVATKSQ